jgi:hypothetical protein
MSKSYPLPITRIEIAHQNDVFVADPNGLILKLLEEPNFFKNLLPLGDGIQDYKLVPTLSIISENPAVIYRASDYEIPLDPNELDRFIRHDLLKNEYHILFQKYGNIFEIHEDFYFPKTGEAIQPIIL